MIEGKDVHAAVHLKVALLLVASTRQARWKETVGRIFYYTHNFHGSSDSYNYLPLSDIKISMFWRKFSMQDGIQFK